MSTPGPPPPHVSAYVMIFALTGDGNLPHVAPTVVAQYVLLSPAGGLIAGPAQGVLQVPLRFGDTAEEIREHISAELRTYVTEHYPDKPLHHISFLLG